jgi:hypothetical protein
LEDRRNIGGSGCNSGDGMDQRVQSLMFMMMMMNSHIPQEENIKKSASVRCVLNAVKYLFCFSLERMDITIFWKYFELFIRRFRNACLTSIFQVISKT